MRSRRATPRKILPAPAALIPIWSRAQLNAAAGNPLMTVAELRELNDSDVPF